MLARGGRCFLAASYLLAGGMYYCCHTPDGTPVQCFYTQCASTWFHLSAPEEELVAPGTDY